MHTFKNLRNVKFKKASSGLPVRVAKFWQVYLLYLGLRVSAFYVKPREGIYVRGYIVTLPCTK